jgi:hypothetical protein
MKKEKKNHDSTCCTQKSLMDAGVHIWVQDVQLFSGVPTCFTSISAPNGLALPDGWAEGRLALETEKTQSHAKCLKNAQTPRRRVHALLGGFFSRALSHNDLPIG